MKYLYSMLIILVAYFALPPVFDFSGRMADHFRQMGKDPDENSPDMYLKQIQAHEKGAIHKPTAIKETKE